jgi:MarR-like DNA-binding transcriptional regulator SgrR of sgrS sRNA
VLPPVDFTIDLEEPVVFFPALISHPATAIVPEGSDPSSPGPEGWVGTGPFRVVAFEPAGGLRWSATGATGGRAAPGARGSS